MNARILATPTTMTLAAWATLVAVTGLVATPPVAPLDATGVAAHVALRLPVPYVALAPVCDVLDALSLLSLRQHVALLATVLVAHALWRWRRRARSRGVLGEVRAVGVLLALVVATYAGGVIVPRPMARLTIADPDVLAVDFHSHTNASHDGRAGFTVARNRAWHRAAGFDAAYVSDHGTLAGIAEARRDDPRRAGDGTTLLPAVEAWCMGQHVVVLGPAPRDTVAECTPALLRDAATGARADAPVVVLAITKRLWIRPTLPLAQAVEVVDGAPRTSDEVTLHHARQSRAVARWRLAAVSGSNNHGWGSTADAWSLVRIPGWRDLSPAALDLAIRGAVRTHDPRTISVVARRHALVPTTALGLAVTAPAIGWTLLTGLGLPERVAWLAWTLGALAWVLVRGRRRVAEPMPAPVAPPDLAPGSLSAA